MLVDQNKAFYFLDKADLKRDRQIRVIRNIEYPLDYYLAHVSRGVPPMQSMSRTTPTQILWKEKSSWRDAGQG